MNKKLLQTRELFPKGDIEINSRFIEAEKACRNYIITFNTKRITFFTKKAFNKPFTQKSAYTAAGIIMFFGARFNLPKNTDLWEHNLFWMLGKRFGPRTNSTSSLNSASHFRFHWNLIKSQFKSDKYIDDKKSCIYKFHNELFKVEVLFDDFVAAYSYLKKGLKFKKDFSTKF
uniref:Uncharacterized protein n=1 Tax=Rhabditophanes sp. KR3021 TaxID=114890 RepID=A0AC35TQN9_9BILA